MTYMYQLAYFRSSVLNFAAFDKKAFIEEKALFTVILEFPVHIHINSFVYYL